MKIVSKLFDIVKQYVDSDLRLYVAPPQQFLDPTKTFWDHSLSPASIVHFQGAGGLTDVAMSMVQDYPLEVSEEMSETQEATELEEQEEDTAQGQVNSFAAPEPKSEKVVPKWFRLK